MRNRMYGGVRGRKTKVGEKLLRFPPTRLWETIDNFYSLFDLVYEFLRDPSRVFTLHSLWW